MVGKNYIVDFNLNIDIIYCRNKIKIYESSEKLKF